MHEQTAGVEWIQDFPFNASFLAAHPDLAAVLRAGEFEGVEFTIKRGCVGIGGTYLAARNSGVHLLTALVVDHEFNLVVPVERAYSYDIGECIPIELDI